jgi:hypothetical protein
MQTRSLTSKELREEQAGMPVVVVSLFKVDYFFLNLRLIMNNNANPPS